MTGGEIQTVRAVVRSVDGDHAWVEAEAGGCGRCHESGGCGGQNLSRALCSRPRQYRVPNPLGARAGESVTLAIDPGSIRRSANLAYILPLTAALAAALAGMAVAGEPGAIAGALGGLVLAYFFVRRRTATASGFPAGRPHIVSRSS